MYFLLFFLLLAGETFAIAPRYYGSQVLNSIDHQGQVILNGTKVLGPITITGGLKAKHATLNSIEVYGLVLLENCTVVTAYVDGDFLARSTQFSGDLSIAAKKVIFDHCTLQSLTVRPIKGYFGQQLITLTNATVVKGTISAPPGQGIIRISPDSIVPDSPQQAS